MAKWSMMLTVAYAILDDKTFTVATVSYATVATNMHSFMNFGVVEFKIPPMQLPDALASFASPSYYYCLVSIMVWLL